MFDKPRSMDPREYLMRVQSVSTNTPLATVEAIVKHQFLAANEAFKNNKSIEISGLCKFWFNVKKAKISLVSQERKLSEWEKRVSRETSPVKLNYLQDRLNDCQEKIEYLKSQLNESA